MAALGEDLLGVVNKLQDLVFNTIGNDSLDLPQIVCHASAVCVCYSLANRAVGCRWLAILW
jgi:dynamin 1-like protein